MPIQRDMKEFFADNGYLVVENLLTSGEMEAVSRRTEEVVADPSTAPAGVSVGREGDTFKDKAGSDAKNRTVRGTAFMGRYDPVFRAFAQNPKILEIVRGLLGGGVKLFRDQMLLKPPGGQEKPLHQDQSYFKVRPVDALVTAWCALDNATEENGCMCYVPGSHKHGIFDIANDPDRPVHHEPVTNGIRLADPVHCPVPAGSVIFHHGCTLHNSHINVTDTWRRAVILHYTTSEALSEIERLNQEISIEID